MRKVLAASGVGAGIAVFAALVLIVVALAFSVTVDGTSMEPTLRDGDRMFLEVWTRDEIERFDVVEADAPSAVSGGAARILKRVIGMPGDRVSVSGDAQVLVRPAGEEGTYMVENPAWSAEPGAELEWLTVPEDAYWLLGDNLGASTDSRSFGFVDAEAVHGRVVFRMFPLGRNGAIAGDVRLAPVEPGSAR
ncbi:signal peptidase I [Nocardioides sp.]|uniref:signal peptidase I n=1 Tax=Nocardioides sp. TaxID=35761 RepID=UPI0019B00026|nr:signal peptidase I [Nocardioides sp.]MBC7278717.1 signal peptidase I [Nocardioides sp.]